MVAGGMGHDFYDESDPLMTPLHRVIRRAGQVRALLMVLVIVWGVGNVVYSIVQKLCQPPVLLMRMNDLLAVFGEFLAVLIAIEIFTNITLYLKSETIPVSLVVATALMAIARKVIIFDYESLSPPLVVGTACVILALGITYWLLTRKS